MLANTGTLVVLCIDNVTDIPDIACLYMALPEMQKVADAADITELFFQLVLIFGPLWVIFGPFWQFWVIFGPIWAILGHFWAILGNLRSFLGHFFVLIFCGKILLCAI